jgi:hypothetical protein
MFIYFTNIFKGGLGVNEISIETLEELFKCIEMSDSPEKETEYLAEEFGIKTDILFFLYLEYKKKSTENYTFRNDIVSIDTIINT